MWATTNGHTSIVQVLLAYSASSEAKSKNGRTIFDLVDLENDKMMSAIHLNVPKEEKKRRSIQPTLETVEKTIEDNEQEQIESCKASFRSVHKFVWNQCLPDQMFVFAEEEMDYILNIAITELRLPMKSKGEIYVPANIIFLCARFAHYFTNRELLHQLLSSSIDKMKQVIQVKTCVLTNLTMILTLYTSFMKTIFIHWPFGLPIYLNCSIISRRMLGWLWPQQNINLNYLN